MIRLPVDPTDEELARDWTLSEEDLVEVRRCRGADKRHSFALQLCVLRRLGRFLSPDEYDAIPVRIMNHVGRQVGRPPVLLVTPPAQNELVFPIPQQLSGVTVYAQAAKQYFTTIGFTVDLTLTQGLQLDF